MPSTKTTNGLAHQKILNIFVYCSTLFPTRSRAAEVF